MVDKDVSPVRIFILVNLDEQKAFAENCSNKQVSVSQWRNQKRFLNSFNKYGNASERIILDDSLPQWTQLS